MFVPSGQGTQSLRACGDAAIVVLFSGNGLVASLSDRGIALLSLDLPGRPQNVIGRDVLTDLDGALESVEATGARLLALFSRKASGFCAGADQNELAAAGSAEEAHAISAQGQRVFARLAELSVPTLAVLHGSCLGGGLELALACDHRVGLDLPTTQLGLPQVESGLIPAWGGTQRLPQLVGLEHALEMILQRRRLGPASALHWGLVDALAVPGPDGLEAQIQEIGEHFCRAGKRQSGAQRPRTWRQSWVESHTIGRALLFRGALHRIRRRVPDDMPASAEAVQAIRVGIRAGMAAGLEYEREAMARLAATPACCNLTRLSLSLDAARRDGAGTDELSPMAEVTRRVGMVGVVGAGTMGAGIAQLAAVRGLEVVVQEVSESARVTAKERVMKLFRDAARRGLLTAEEAQTRTARVAFTTSWVGFENAGIVVEAVPEKVETKREIFRELERRVGPGSVLTTNTSSLSVTSLQQGLDHPSRFAGFHLFNPVERLPLVEIVRGSQTSAAIVTTLKALALSLGKIAVVVNDSPGFLVNRILVPYLNEAVRLAAEGVTFERIDRVMRRFGMPMGPLELLDQVGLDVAAEVAASIAISPFGRFARNAVLARMCERGWLGRKSAAGFYEYRGKAKRANRNVQPILRESAPPLATRAAPQARVSLPEIRERMVLVMVNEAAACLAGGVADTAEVVDLAMVLGAGWAPHRGGPLRYADELGAAMVVERLVDLCAVAGSRFEPCDDLRQRAERGQPFYPRTRGAMSATDSSPT